MTASGRPRKFIGVSLKMYFGHAGTIEWCNRVSQLTEVSDHVSSGQLDLVVIPSYPALPAVAAKLNAAGVKLGAQNLFWEDSGPFTGEVSGRQLLEVGCEFVEVGHAERRSSFGETDEIVRMKVAAAIRNRLTPIVCVGETMHTTSAEAARTCGAQLRSSIAEVPVNTPVVIAYEPVWAIGKESAAPVKHIGEVCTALRRAVRRRSDACRVIYGGSAGSGLIQELKDEIDGLFLGRFAHDPGALASVLREAGRVWS